MFSILLKYKSPLLLICALSAITVLMLQPAPARVYAQDVPQADLSLKQITNTASFDVGGTLTYTLLIVNNGPNTATGIRVDDTMPAEVGLVSAASTQGSCAATVSGVGCSLNDLSSGGFETVTVVVQGKSPVLVLNLASVSANEVDVNLNNNSSYRQTTLHNPGDTNPDMTVNIPVVVMNEGQTVQASGGLSLPLQSGAMLSTSFGALTQTVFSGSGGTWVWQYTANFGAPRNQTVMITATDPTGRQARITFEVVVNHVNRAPAASYDFATTRQDTTVYIAVLTNDTDPDGDALTLTGVNTPPQNGIIQIFPDQTILYGPNPGFHGTDTFTYGISDGLGGQSSALVTISVIASGLPNTAPTAGNDRYALFRNSSITVNAVQMLYNDIDPDGDKLTITSASSMTPANGSVTLNPDQTITLTPAQGFVGNLIGTYTVSDGRGGTSSATITVDVFIPVGSNRAPIAGDDAFKTGQNVNIRIYPSDLLRNDSDPDGDHLTITGFNLGSNIPGWLIMNTDGSVTFNPYYTYTGVINGTYQVSDGRGGITTGKLTITVGG